MTFLDRFAGSRAGRLLLDFRFAFIACCVVVSAAAALKVVMHPVAWDGTNHASYNNFIIFRNSFLDLVTHRDLYAWHLDRQWDLFKYSPAFAVLMAPFACMPTLPGLVLWSLLNTVPLLIAFRLLPLPPRASQAAMYLVLVELVTSVQSAQSNGLVAALLLLTFVALERKRVALGSLCTVLNVAIKVFGVAGFVLFVPYPGKRRAAALSVAWLVIVAALPLLFVGPTELADIYRRWFALLRADTARANSVSVYGWLGSWFHVAPPREIVLLAGGVLLALPLVRLKAYGERTFRLLLLASLLIWVVIFNHKAESPTFVIAMCGAAVWFFASPPSRLNRALLVLAFVLTSLSPTDIFPPSMRRGFFANYSVKAVPMVAIWCVITARLLFGFREPAVEDATAENRRG